MVYEEYGKNIAIMRYDDPNNWVKLLEDTVKKFPDRPYIGEKDENGVFQWITYKLFAKRVNNLRAALDKIGVVKGDSVGNRIFTTFPKNFPIALNPGIIQ